eukprot:12066410-Alexandrium_andersonii.AAC.1
MSASLVGSEMCIRDRRVGEERRLMEGVEQQAAPRAGEARDSPLALSPVSYTHLTLPTICSV